tara:strand:- start:361 stop:1104 length:744 start_codon:yes stop_codon:yes gene_type:complete
MARGRQPAQPNVQFKGSGGRNTSSFQPITVNPVNFNLNPQTISKNVKDALTLSMQLRDQAMQEQSFKVRMEDAMAARALAAQSAALATEARNKERAKSLQYSLPTRSEWEEMTIKDSGTRGSLFNVGNAEFNARVSQLGDEEKKMVADQMYNLIEMTQKHEAEFAKNDPNYRPSTLAAQTELIKQEMLDRKIFDDRANMGNRLGQLISNVFGNTAVVSNQQLNEAIYAMTPDGSTMTVKKITAKSNP